MKRIRFRKKQHQQMQKIEIFPVNEKILKISQEVSIIDDEGNNLGTKPTSQAIEMAKEQGLDLICVSPKARPPVTKIMDYGSFKYKKEKQLKKQKLLQKQGEMKTLRLSPRIGKHDLDVKIKQAIKFIEKKSKVKIELILRGREMQYKDQANETIQSFIDQLQEQIEVEIKIEQAIKKIGNRFEVIIAPNQQ